MGGVVGGRRELDGNVGGHQELGGVGGGLIVAIPATM